MIDVDKIRVDFPILSRTVYGRSLVYLDNAATGQKPRCVIMSEQKMYSELNANVHRGVHYMSEQCTELYEQARRTVAGYIGAAAPSEIIFTSGATAGLNLVAYSYGELAFEDGDNIIVSEMEHHSNIVPWQIVAERKGVQIRMLPINDDGELQIDMLDSLMDDRTKMVAVTQASNVLGTIPDVELIVRKAHAKGVPVTLDGCQGVVHCVTDVQRIGCDFYAFSGHKLYGPNGTGVLYGRKELLEKMPPFMGGGDMIKRVSFTGTTYADVPLKFESGTPNYIGAIGLAKAIEYLKGFDLQEVERHEWGLVEYVTEQLEKIEGLRIYGKAAHKCSIVSFNVEGVHNYDLGMILDKLGIAVRTGAHCADPLMGHYGVQGMCRASFAIYNTEAEAEALCNGVERAVKMLKKR